MADTVLITGNTYPVKESITWYLTVHAFGLYLDVCGKTRAARS